MAQILWTSILGEHIQCFHMRSLSGTTHFTPFKGSRMIPERNAETAGLGLPGRIEIVGKRKENPLIRPLRVRSLIIVSQMIFWHP